MSEDGSYFQLNQDAVNSFLFGAGHFAARSFKIQPQYLPFALVEQLACDVIEQSAINSNTKDELDRLVMKAREFLLSPMLWQA